MNSQARFTPEEYHSSYDSYPYSSTLDPPWPLEDDPISDTQGYSRSLDTYDFVMHTTRGIAATVEEAGTLGLDMRNPDSYSIQEPYQPLGTVHSSEHPLTSNASDTTHGYPRFFTMHPIRGMIAELGYGGTVVRVYGPPLESIAPNGPEFSLLWREDSRVVVPQHPYKCGTAQKNWHRKPSVCFLTRRSPGVRLRDALHGKFEGMDDKDHLPFDACCTAITVRIHFPGYTSSTNVEKRLKEQEESDGRATARSMQVCTNNHRHKVPTGQMTKSKLVEEVSKRIWWHISDLGENRDLFPFDDRVGEQWRLGQGRMKVQHMVITELIHVSSGSWSPIIYVE